MIVGLNPNYILKQRNCAFAPAYRVNFEGTNRSNMTSAPTSDFFESSTTGQTSLEKTMTATEVLEQLINLQKKYRKNHIFLSEYTIGDFIQNVELENAKQHLISLEKLLNLNCSRIVNVCKNGYFSSSEGAEAIDFVIKHFKTENENGFISPADCVLFKLTPKETLNIRDRKLISLDRNDNSWSDRMGNLAKLSDEEYLRYVKSGQEELIYLSENNEINKIFLILLRNNDFSLDNNIKEMKKLDAIIQQDLAANPDKKDEILAFYRRFVQDNNYQIDNIETFKKAYTYLDKNGIENAKPIIIKDSSKVNYYNIDKIIDLFKNESQKDSWGIALFDINGNFLRYNSASNEGLQVTETVASKELKQKFNAKLEDIGDAINIIESTKEIFDLNGNLVCIEHYVKSKDMPNKYDIYREFPNGEKYKIGFTEISENGNLSIEKTLTTSKGIKTDYNYMETPDGSRLSYTRITDAEGNVLAENKYKYQILDEYHFKTTENDIEYYIQYNESILGDFVRVSSTDGRKIVLPIGRNSTYASSVLSKNLLPLLKRMPGSFYFDIAKYGLKKIGLNIDNVKSDGAYYNTHKNLIAVSNTWKDADFTLAHEIGHYRDEFKKISKNPEVIETYLKERETFMENEPQYEMFATNYMIDASPRRSETFIDSLAELVAEVNAFLYASNIAPNIEMRGQFVQEHFPETFAKIANLLLNK